MLSFSYEDREIPDEIYISLQKAKAQAPKWKNSFYGELQRLVIHGCLHLCGYDHKTAAQRKIMESRENSSLKSFKQSV